VTFGDFPAFICLASMLLEFVIGNAVVARGFSSYLARLLNQEPFYFRLGCGSAQGGKYDVMAAGKHSRGSVGVTLLVTAILALGGRENAMLISGTTVLKLLLLLMIAITGFTQANGAQMTPFLELTYGFDGLWIGASLLFFIYTGFGALGAAAEEVTEVRHIPYAMVGTAGIAGVLYLMLSLSLALMTCPNAGCPAPQWQSTLGNLTFVSAFQGSGLAWMQYIVSVAALCGVLTSLVVGMFSISRIVMSASRDAMLPPVLARVSRRTQTPVLALLVLGVIIAIISLLVENSAAATMSSFGALVSLWMVCNIQLYRRYWPDAQIRVTRHGTVVTTPSAHTVSLRSRKLLLWAHLLLINALCIALAIYYQLTATYSVEGGGTPDLCAASPKPADAAPPPVCYPGGCEEPKQTFKREGSAEIWCLVGAWLLTTLSLQLWCPLEYTPEGWHVPACLMPWLPSVAINLVVFSVGALPTNDYEEVGWFYGAALLFYLLVSLPLSYIKQSSVDWVNAEELRVVELRFIDGAWRPMLPHHGLSAHSTAHSMGAAGAASLHASGSTLSLAPTIHCSAGSLAAAGARPGSSGMMPHPSHSAFRGVLGAPTPTSTGSSSGAPSNQLSPHLTPRGSALSGGMPSSSPRGSIARQSGGTVAALGGSGGGGGSGGLRGADPSLRTPSTLPAVPEHNRSPSLS
ncbi:hypothetical protein COHA_001949, partial [Chlorella ohadii]